jgi:hypothetical protein
MRLAGTAAPLPRKSGRLESNQRSPVPETGGVAKLPHSQMESTTVESNHACPPYQGGACPATRRRGAPPGNRTLLHGFTARGLATSLATQSRREESNPRGPR